MRRIYVWQTRLDEKIKEALKMLALPVLGKASYGEGVFEREVKVNK